MDFALLQADSRFAQAFLTSLGSKFGLPMGHAEIDVKALGRPTFHAGTATCELHNSVELTGSFGIIYLNALVAAFPLELSLAVSGTDGGVNSLC